MSTKEIILNTAIELYNTKGFVNVNSREIAKVLGKSHGNIEYHFKTKESLLLAIYKNMSAEITTYYDQLEDTHAVFEKFNILLIRLELFQLKYRFFNLDILEISRIFPTVNSLLQKTLNRRKIQMGSFFNHFIQEGFIKKEEFSGDYLRLQHTIRIVITFWPNQQLVLSSYDFEGRGEMAEHIWILLCPYMTAKGHDYYKRLIKMEV